MLTSVCSARIIRFELRQHAVERVARSLCWAKLFSRLLLCLSIGLIVVHVTLTMVPSVGTWPPTHFGHLGCIERLTRVSLVK